jgi:hypothetical protein
MPKRTTETDLSYATEQELSRVIVSMHPHKEHPAMYRVKSLIVRAGWAYYKGLCAREVVE